MSHFTVGVILPERFNITVALWERVYAVQEYIDTAMQPFDENREVNPYPRKCYCGGSVASQRARIHAEMLVGECPSYHENPARWEEYHETFHDYMQYQPDQYDHDPDCKDCKGTGFYQTTYNPLSKWDGYSIGGRWHGVLPDNKAKLGDLLAPFKPFFAVLTPEGEWIERGEMGWWAVVTNEKDEDEWHNMLREIYKRYAEHWVVVLDAHI